LSDSVVLRTIDDVGRINIPTSMRRLVDIQLGDHLEIFVDDSVVILKKIESECICCKSKLSLISFKDRKICRSCLNELKML
jgi:transcriptional pleiotropic regulator of transition state genes